MEIIVKASEVGSEKRHVGIGWGKEGAKWVYNWEEEDTWWGGTIGGSACPEGNGGNQADQGVLEAKG